MADDKRLYLVDASSFIHRAYHAVRPLSSRAGVPTNAVFGYTSMLLKLLQKENPTHLAVAMDGPPPTLRADIYPEYKANRPPAPEDLVPQFELCRRMTEAFNIPTLEKPRVEADDIIATLARQGERAAFEVTIVSSDKDLMQLVGPTVVLFDSMKDKVFDVAAVTKKFGVGPGQLRDLLALMGDSSDNVPGVAGIGPKSAAALLTAHGDLEGVLAAAPGLKGKRGKTLVEQAALARLSARLVTLDEEVELGVTLDDLVRRPVDLAPIAELFEELDFHRMLDTVRAFADGGGAEVADASGPAASGLDVERYETIDSLERLDEVLALALNRGELAVDLETTSLSTSEAEIVGFALCWGPGEAGYVPVAHRGLALDPQLDRDTVLDRMRPLLEAESPRLHMQNHKYEYAIFQRHGIALRGVGCDPMIASYLLDPSASGHGLDALAQRELGHRMIAFKEVCGTGKSARGFDEVEIPVATRYAAEDAEATFLLAGLLTPRLLEQPDLERLMWEVEVPLARVLALMELHGIALDIPRLKELSERLTARLADLETEVEKMGGVAVNLNSPKQLQGLLFEHLGLKPIRKTKTGYSTDAEVLEQLAEAHPVAALIHEYRQLQKLKSTYVDALPRAADGRGRLHTSYNQAVAATGRLSSSDPNLQNIPVRTALGREIRSAFVAREGSLLVSADYSQIELRVLAHLSGDAVLAEAFLRDEDVHARTAAEVFGVFPDTVDREQRRVAKAVNFGVIYGQSAFGLSRQLKIGRNVAQGYIDSYFARYKGVAAYMDRVIEEAGRTGYTTTLLGRRRPLPELNSRNQNLRNAAERMARNTPIQGSAADIIKLAMLRCQERLERDFPDARMLLTVHDELVFEVAQDEAAPLAAAMTHEMERAWQLDVPLKVDVGMGRDWLAAH